MAVVTEMLASVNESAETFTKIGSALGVEGPRYFEYQYLQNGFGYNVYKEGFNTFLHFEVQ